MLLISISIIKRKPQNVNHKIRSDGIFCTIRPDANAPPAGVGRCRRARVAVCTAIPARGASCERWALSARLSGSGNIVGGRGELLVDVGRCWWAQVAACGMRRCLRTLVAVCAAFSGARERRPVLRTPPPFRAAHGACRSACPLAARPHPPVVVRASPPARWPHAPRPSAAPRAAPPLDIPPQRCYYNIAFRGGMAVCGASDWVWRSLVACLNGVQEAGGSNPLTQTTASEQSPLCSDVFFASGRCICRKKAAVAPLPCSSFSAKGPARLACSLASALTTARCRYQPFAAAAPRGAGDGPGRARRTEKTRRRSRQYGVRPSEKPPRRYKPRTPAPAFPFVLFPPRFPHLLDRHKLRFCEGDKSAHQSKAVFKIEVLRWKAALGT